MFSQNQVHKAGWDCLSVGLLDGVKTMLEFSEPTGDMTEKTMKILRLVNLHWSQWATNATTRLRAPRNGGVVRELVELITEKFCNLDSLQLNRMPFISDEDVCIVSALPGLACVDLSLTGPLCY